MASTAAAELEARVLAPDNGPPQPLASDDDPQRATSSGERAASTKASSAGSREHEDVDKDEEEQVDLAHKEPVAVKHKWCVPPPRPRSSASRAKAGLRLLPPAQADDLPLPPHCRALFDPFVYKAPAPPPASMDDAPTIGIAKASWLSQTTFCASFSLCFQLSREPY